MTNEANNDNNRRSTRLAALEQLYSAVTNNMADYEDGEIVLCLVEQQMIDACECYLEEIK